MKKEDKTNMRFATTLGKIWDCGPCGKGWYLLTSSLGTSDRSTIVTLAQVLDSNGIKDAMWAFRCISTEDRLVLRSFVVDCAERVLPSWEDSHPDDPRPRECIEAARGYIAGTVSLEELEEKRAAAKAAAKAAASYASSVYAAAKAAADFADADFAAKAAAAAAAADFAAKAAAYFADFAAFAASYACSSAFYACAAAYFADSSAAEREWQARRLRQYLAGEAT